MNKDEKIKIAKQIYDKLNLADQTIEIIRDDEINADYVWIPGMRGPGGLIIGDDGSYLFCQSAHGFEYWKDEYKKGERSLIFENSEFVLRIQEGTYMPGNKTYKVVVICDKIIIKDINGNKSKKEDLSISDKIKQLVLSEINKIKEFDNMFKTRQVSTYKSSRQANLNIKLDNVNYIISGTADNKEIADFYTNFSNKIFQLLD